MPVIPVIRKLKQEIHEFEVSLAYIVRPYLKEKVTLNYTVHTLIIRYPKGN
jgi:hypothetical protein